MAFTLKLKCSTLCDFLKNIQHCSTHSTASWSGMSKSVIIFNKSMSCYFSSEKLPHTATSQDPVTLQSESELIARSPPQSHTTHCYSTRSFIQSCNQPWSFWWWLLESWSCNKQLKYLNVNLSITAAALLITVWINEARCVRQWWRKDKPEVTLRSKSKSESVRANVFSYCTSIW